MKQELSDKQREQMFKIRDDFLASIRTFFDIHIITGDLGSIEKLVKVNKRFFDRHTQTLKERRERDRKCEGYSLEVELQLPYEDAEFLRNYCRKCIEHRWLGLEACLNCRLLELRNQAKEANQCRE
jgi:hypothetical protein